MSLLFHYRGAHTVKVDRSDHDRLFAGRDGTPASRAASQPA